MNHPMNFQDGIIKFMSLYGKNASLVLIPTRFGTGKQLETIVYDYGVKAADVATYIPPDGVGHNFGHRVEKIPNIKYPELPHLIIDDSIEGGGTSDCAYGRLCEQGVVESNVWLTVGTIIHPKANRGPHFDRLQVYYDFIDNN